MVEVQAVMSAFSEAKQSVSDELAAKCALDLRATAGVCSNRYLDRCRDMQPIRHQSSRLSAEMGGS